MRQQRQPPHLKSQAGRVSRKTLANIHKYINKTHAAIDAYWSGRADVYEREMGTLRASELGEECSRKLWYRSRQYKEPIPEPRILRLFDRGHKEEDRVLEWLNGIGCEIWDQQKQVRYKDFFTGHIDGLVIGVPEVPSKTHLLEVKTYNDKNFKKLQKEGVPFQHKVQMQIYMYLLGIDRVLYIAVNKNDDDLHIERIKLDKEFAEAQLIKAERIIFMEKEPERIGPGNESFFKCKWCGMRDICYRKEIT